jgi:putative membrane protein
MHWYGFGWGGMVFGGLMMLLFWGGLAAIVVWAIRASASRTDRPSYDRGSLPTARDLLDQRYARGEISRQEYEIMKDDLKRA